MLGLYEYDAWGNLLSQTGSEILNINPFRYRGYYYDAETGLYYLNSRYYDPETGRFISPDSLKYLDPTYNNGLNLYTYCGNNPVVRFDPKGADWWHWVLGSVVLVGLAVAVVCTAGAAGVGVGTAFLSGFTGTAILGAGGTTAAATACTILSSAFATSTVMAGLGFVSGGLVYDSGAISWDWDSASEGFGYGAVSGMISGALMSPSLLGKVGKGFSRRIIQGGINSFLSGALYTLQGAISNDFSWESLLLSLEFGALSGAFGNVVFQSIRMQVLQICLLVGGIPLMENVFSELFEWLLS